MNDAKGPKSLGSEFPRYRSRKESVRHRSASAHPSLFGEYEEVYEPHSPSGLAITTT
jgi:hypothetical protein